MTAFAIHIVIGDESFEVVKGVVEYGIEDGMVEVYDVSDRETLKSFPRPELGLIASWLCRPEVAEELRQQYEDDGGKAAARADHVGR